MGVPMITGCLSAPPPGLTSMKTLKRDEYTGDGKNEEAGCKKKGENVKKSIAKRETSECRRGFLSLQKPPRYDHLMFQAACLSSLLLATPIQYYLSAK